MKSIHLWKSICSKSRDYSACLCTILCIQLPYYVSHAPLWMNCYSEAKAVRETSHVHRYNGVPVHTRAPTIEAVPTDVCLHITRHPLPVMYMYIPLQHTCTCTCMSTKWENTCSSTCYSRDLLLAEYGNNVISHRGGSGGGQNQLPLPTYMYMYIEHKTYM